MKPSERIKELWFADKEWITPAQAIEKYLDEEWEKSQCKHGNMQYISYGERQYFNCKDCGWYVNRLDPEYKDLEWIEQPNEK